MHLMRLGAESRQEKEGHSALDVHAVAATGCQARNRSSSWVQLLKAQITVKSLHPLEGSDNSVSRNFFIHVRQCNTFLQEDQTPANLLTTDVAVRVSASVSCVGKAVHREDCVTAIDFLRSGEPSWLVISAPPKNVQHPKHVLY